MKLKFLSLIHVPLLSLIFPGSNYEKNNDIQLTLQYSFVKLKLKSSYNLQGKGSGKKDDKGRPELLSVVRRGSPPPSPRNIRPRNEQTGSRRPRNQPLYRMPSWPPTEGPGRPITGTSSRTPGLVSEGYSWPPVEKRRASLNLKSSTPSVKSPYKQMEDKEDLFTAIRVEIREDEEDLSDIQKPSDSESESDPSTPGTPVDKKAALEEESELSPEIAEKIRKMKEKSAKIVQEKLSKNKVSELIKDPNLDRKVMLIPIPLLVALLEQIYKYLTSGLVTIVTIEDIKKIDLEVSSSSSSKSSAFLAKMKEGNNQIESLKTKLKDKFNSKYSQKCNFELLKSLANSYREKYLECSGIDLEIAEMSNPRKGMVENRGQKLMGLYLKLKTCLPNLKKLEAEFMECYVTYLEKIDSTKSEVKKKETCTWEELLLLEFFLTAFKGYAMLTTEALTLYENDISKYERLKEKSETELTDSEKQELLSLSPNMEKLLKLRMNNELNKMLSSALQSIIQKCINHLKSET